ncbi:histidinol dehydrogenase [Sphingorhabdus arenilitoris]|uniref:Histidinol dehydrogenase n=1 Tax=Sphingorhabdus arenilitoris TaxID=1490041 RepID=A0ABV8RJI8_9SPHN
MLRLNTTDTGFAEAFDILVGARRESDAGVAADVSRILADVKAGGDAVLRELTQKFDRFDLDSNGWQISAAQCAAAYAALEPDLRDALDLAAQRITSYHQAQLPENRDYRDDQGVRLGAKWNGVDAAGLYVPGGRAAYPSSVLMNAIPAKVAGVGRLVMVTPTPDGEVNQTVLAAAHIAGVDEIWRVGGAQAVAALAYGTEKIAPVDVITGPGNAWVAEAKRQLYGVVGIDMVAGPSEIVVVADGQNDPEWTAADLLSQAEHDLTSQSILFTDDAAFADAVTKSVDVQIAALSTGKVAGASWRDHGAVIVTDSLESAMPLVNLLAAEHVELATDMNRAEALFAAIRHAGSVFLGRHTPEAIGDYVAGPNHVLPTGRRARFASGLSVLDFMKRTSFIALDEDSVRKIGPAAARLADAEGLPAHAASVRKRLK